MKSVVISTRSATAHLQDPTGNHVTFLLDLILILTGEIHAAVHISVIEEYKDEFIDGCVAILRQVPLLQSDLIVFLYRCRF